MDDPDPPNEPGPRTPHGRDTLTPTEVLDELRLGRVPIAELIRSAPSGDYRAHVELRRAFIVLSQDPEAVAKFANDSLRITEQTGVLADPQKFHQRIRREDTTRRFQRLAEKSPCSARPPAVPAALPPAQTPRRLR